MKDVNHENFKNAEQRMALQKMQKHETNLPGFVELKIGEDLAANLAR